VYRLLIYWKFRGVKIKYIKQKSKDFFAQKAPTGSLLLDVLLKVYKVLSLVDNRCGEAVLLFRFIAIKFKVNDRC